MRVTADDGVELDVAIEGPKGAAALVLLHSLGCDRRMWDRQVEVLRDRFLIVRPDLRGHGRSHAPAEAYTLARLGRDVEVVINTLEIPRAHICGISLGGMVALWLSMHIPDRVHRLILANTSCRIGTAEIWQSRIDTVRARNMEGIADTGIGRFFSEPFRSARPDVVAGFREQLLMTSPHGYIGCCAALRDSDLTPELHRIRAPTLVVAGTHDISVSPKQLEDLARGIIGARLATLDAGHLSNIEQPSRFEELLRRHLEGPNE